MAEEFVAAYGKHFECRNGERYVTDAGLVKYSGPRCSHLRIPTHKFRLSPRRARRIGKNGSSAVTNKESAGPSYSLLQRHDKIHRPSFADTGSLSNLMTIRCRDVHYFMIVFPLELVRKHH